MLAKIVQGSSVAVDQAVASPTALVVVIDILIVALTGVAGIAAVELSKEPFFSSRLSESVVAVVMIGVVAAAVAVVVVAVVAVVGGEGGRL